MSEVSGTSVAPSSTDSASTSEQNSEASISTGEQGKETPTNIPNNSQKKKFKYKADGAEVEEELDDSEIASRLSLAKAAHKRMQEAAEKQKRFDWMEKTLKENPLQILSDESFGGTKKFREVAEKFLIQQLEEEALTPEQRSMKEKERKLAEYEAKEKERQQVEEQSKTQQLEDHYRQEYEKTIISALELSNLPKTESTVKRMAALMQKNITLGLDLEPQYIAQLVREDFISEQKSLVGSMSAEQLIAMFGDEVANKIRKHDLSRFKQENPKPKVVENKPSAPERKMSPREYTEYLKAKFAPK